MTGYLILNKRDCRKEVEPKRGGGGKERGSEGKKKKEGDGRKKKKKKRELDRCKKAAHTRKSGRC